MADDQLLVLAEELGTALKKRGWLLAPAESCTGGWVAQSVTAIAGSSAWFDRGFVTYSIAAKMEMLGVNETTLASFGAVSIETAQEMALGALKHSNADIAVAITGIAGPDGGSAEKPVGTVCLAWAASGVVLASSTQHFFGNRQSIRAQAVESALRGLIKVL